MRLHNIGYLSKNGIQGIWKNKMMSFASIGSLTACFLLIGCAAVFAICINQVMDVVGKQNEMTAYLAERISQADTEAANEAIRRLDGIEDTTLFSAEDNLLSMSEQLGESPENLLNEKEDNPFLASISIRVSDPQTYEDVMEQVTRIGNVISVKGSPRTASLLVGMQKITFNASIVLVLILLVVSVLIVSNTIRITIFSRRKEISIMKYVGATDRFIRIPFLIEGMAIGTLSSIVSVVILYFSVDFFIKQIYENFAERVEVGFIMSCISLSWEVWGFLLVLFLVIGGLVGSIGGGLFVRKYLNV